MTMTCQILCLALLLVLVGCGEQDPGNFEVIETGVPGEGLDREVLDQLRQAGSDLSKPTEIRWYTYFPDEASARAYGGTASSSPSSPLMRCARSSRA